MQRRARHWLGSWGAALTVVLGVASANADRPSEQASQRADDIASQTMSPFCPGRTLASCPSPSATEWRQDIREWTEQGASAREVRQRLQRRVPGFNLSGSPSTSLGWGLPILLAVGGVGLLAFVLKRLRRATRAEGADTQPAAAGATEGDATEADSRQGAAPDIAEHAEGLDDRLDQELRYYDER